jgi:hypothetical protein
MDMDIREKNKPFFVDVRDKFLDLRTGNTQLLKNIRKVKICYVAKDGEKFTKLSLIFKTFRSWSAKYAAVIALRKLKKLRSITLLWLKKFSKPIKLLPSMKPHYCNRVSRPHCERFPITAPHVVTQYGTQYVRPIFQSGGSVHDRSTSP